MVTADPNQQNSYISKDFFKLRLFFPCHHTKERIRNSLSSFFMAAFHKVDARASYEQWSLHFHCQGLGQAWLLDKCQSLSMNPQREEKGNKGQKLMGCERKFKPALMKIITIKGNRCKPIWNQTAWWQWCHHCQQWCWGQTLRKAQAGFSSRWQPDSEAGLWNWI